MKLINFIKMFFETEDYKIRRLRQKIEGETKDKKVLDLGCGKNKLKNSFGVDFVNFEDVDLVYDLNKQLPKKFHKKFDVVFSYNVLDHIGNPLNFLEGCYKYLNKGKLILIVDNADYWRYHVKLGNYHADVYSDMDKNIITHHKMMFQMTHLIKMLKMLNFKIVKTNYFRDSKWYRHHIDYLFPRLIGCNMILIEAIKE